MRRWTHFLGALVLFVCFWVGPSLIFGYFTGWNYEKAGQIGDSFGAINACFSGAALLGVLFVLYREQEERTETRHRDNAMRCHEMLRPLEATRALHDVLKSDVRQQFEATSSSTAFEQAADGLLSKVVLAKDWAAAGENDRRLGAVLLEPILQAWHESIVESVLRFDSWSHRKQEAVRLLAECIALMASKLHFTAKMEVAKPLTGPVRIRTTNRRGIWPGLLDRD